MNKIGLGYLKFKQYHDAALAFDSAAKTDPSDAKLLSNLGFAETHDGDLSSAEKHLYLSLTLAPTRSVAWGDLGELFARNGDKDNATACFLIGYEVSSGKTGGYLKDLAKDNDYPAARDAAVEALNKISIASNRKSKQVSLAGLGMSLKELQQRFNNVSKTCGFTLQISHVKLSHTNGGNTFESKITDNISLDGQTDNVNADIRRVVLKGKGNGTVQSGAELVASDGVLIASVDPTLSPDDRGQLLKDLGLLDTNTDIHHLNNTVIRNGKEYTLVSSDAAPFVLTVSNSQEQ